MPFRQRLGRVRKIDLNRRKRASARLCVLRRAKEASAQRGTRPRGTTYLCRIKSIRWVNRSQHGRDALAPLDVPASRSVRGRRLPLTRSAPYSISAPASACLQAREPLEDPQLGHRIRLRRRAQHAEVGCSLSVSVARADIKANAGVISRSDKGTGTRRSASSCRGSGTTRKSRRWKSSYDFFG